MKFNWKDLFRPPLLTKVLVIGGYILAAALLTKLSLWGIREPSNPLTRISVFLLLILFTPSRLTFWPIIFPLSLIIGCYAPIAHVYGLPDYQALVSLLATDRTEATEFLGLVPTKFYIKGLCIPLLAIATHLLARHSGLKLWRNKAFVLVAVFFIFVAQPPTAFYTRLVKAVNDYCAVSNYSLASSWPASTTTSPPKDYVLIIGESVRRDYMHIYGYPVDNTPFLDRINATIVDGFSAGGAYTAESLGNMLTNGSGWTPRFDRTVVDLAKTAGLKVIWITNNQGTLVDARDEFKWNTPTTAIAAKSNKTFWFKANTKDIKLLDSLEDVLKKQTNEPRLIIIHMRGSHYDACSRVSDMPDKYRVFNRHYDYIACYVSSIKQTDQFIEHVYNILEKQKELTGRQFSIIYFSDHGQGHLANNGRLILQHNIYLDKKSKYLYDVPLIEIDSQQQERKEFKSRKSGLRFTEGLANWMGISNPDIREYDLFDGVDDSSDFGLSEITKNSISDPAIDITSFLESK